jgi:hypothetical protein
VVNRRVEAEHQHDAPSAPLASCPGPRKLPPGRDDRKLGLRELGLAAVYGC